MGNDIVLNYDINSSLYVLNEKFKVKFNFGFSGREMSTDYRETHGYDDAENNFIEDRNRFGYYNYVKAFKEAGIIFRTYSKGEKNTDGLQVYNYDYNLIADLDVPKGYKIIGHNGNIYCVECNEGLKQQPMYILRFKLEHK